MSSDLPERRIPVITLMFQLPSSAQSRSMYALRSTQVIIRSFSVSKLELFESFETEKAICPRSAQEWMGNTAMQEVATVLVAHSGLVPEGSSRSRAASELAEMFARADGGTEALPDKGPDAAARSALEFLRRLTESLGLVE